MLLEMPDLKIRNPYLSLAMEDAIAEVLGENHAAQGMHGVFRFWANNYSVVLGRTCDARRNIRSEHLEPFVASMNPLVWKRRPVIVRRLSGGGTVLHGPGNVNFSIFLPMVNHPELYPVHHSYSVFLSLVSGALEAQGISCGVRGLSDIVLDVETGGAPRKISGNAQFRKYGVIVHHGTLIVQKDIIALMSRFLNHPPAEPDYRQNRSHDEFLMNLPDGFDLSSFYSAMVSRLRSYLGAESGPLPAVMRDEVVQRARAKVRHLYARREWVLDGVFSQAEQAGAAAR